MSKLWVLALTLLCAFFAPSALSFTNPLKNPNGSDPFIVHDSGYYYLTTTTWNNVQITRATSIAGLKTATPVTVYSTSTASRCCNVWAPEIHKVNGIWYIYFTAGQNTDLGGQRAHVLQGKSDFHHENEYSAYLVLRMYNENGIEFQL